MIQKAKPHRVSVRLFWNGSTAAAEQNQESDDDQPNGIILKQIAQTVHLLSSFRT